jgi:tRNA pseudouridine13 synthase
MSAVTTAAERQPFLTSGVTGIGGRIKARPEDFQVEERPLYLPCGDGEHLYVRITKRGLSTPDLVLRLSSVLGVKAKGIGVAGLKDAQAVTTQMVSLHGVAEEKLSRLRFDEQVLSMDILGRHRNRLRKGHHAGNTFHVKVRDVCLGAATTVPEVLRELQCRGVPNYFGPQRQGRRGLNHQTGAQLLNDPDRRKRMGKSQRMWYLNAYQSYIFNRLLGSRIDRIDTVLLGDWAMKHENGACFQVNDPAVEQPRADRFEISPTGILFGSRAPWASGEPGAIERAVVSTCGATPESLSEAGAECGFRGERRAFRIRLDDLVWSLDQGTLSLTFSLPAGAYATSVLRELMKLPE